MDEGGSGELGDEGVKAWLTFRPLEGSPGNSSLLSSREINQLTWTGGDRIATANAQGRWVIKVA